MTPKERAELIWNASSQSQQDRRAFTEFVAEHIAVAEAEAVDAARYASIAATRLGMTPFATKLLLAFTPDAP